MCAGAKEKRYAKLGVRPLMKFSAMNRGKLVRHIQCTGRHSKRRRGTYASALQSSSVPPAKHLWSKPNGLRSIQSPENGPAPPALQFDVDVSPLKFAIARS